MNERPSIESEFLSQLTAIVEKNISNEQFGVSELASEMNMSRSNLLRKVKKDTKLSVSQLISQVRLKRAMELLKTSSLNVSEVSHRVGFSSTSYFIKCFREYYGYPPGEVSKREGAIDMPPNATNVVQAPTPAVNTNGRKVLIICSAAAVLILSIGLIYFMLQESRPRALEKSIAVLPFKNESSDSSNVYLINGLMESTLTNLQLIKDLKVTSRTSTERYRDTKKSIPEVANELNVSYLVEGSGQKIGDGIVLNIQLIEGSTDRHLWAKQYRRQGKDIFELQEEVAKDIAGKIEVIITPEEERKIEKKFTASVLAYDHFLKGKDLFYKSTRESLQASIPYFKKAIAEDNQFALAYAHAAMVYYYLDIFQADRKYGMEITACADNAMEFDAALTESMIAKALSYAHKYEYKPAVEYLEKALERDPNSGLLIHFLTEFYNWYIPNTAKYLEYALKGVKVDIISHDSSTISYKYLHLSNALLQAGFIDEAIRYINKSLSYDSSNVIARYVRVWFLFAKNKDINEAKQHFIEQLDEDTTRLDVNQEVGKFFYLMRDYKSAYKYYDRFLQLSESKELNMFTHENLKIAIVLSKMGFAEKSSMYLKTFKEYADNDKSVYKHINLAAYYSYLGDSKKAVEHLRLFSKEDNYVYWVLWYDMDTAFDGIKNNPEFKNVMRDIERRFWKTHQEIKEMLEEKRLI